MLTLELPYPPSGNAVVRHAAGLRSKDSERLAERINDFRWSVVVAVKAARHFKALEGPCAVLVTVEHPARHRCDLDNLLKLLFDSLTAAKVWRDDSQAAELVVKTARREHGIEDIDGPPRNGRLWVSVMSIAELEQRREGYALLPRSLLDPCLLHAH